MKAASDAPSGFKTSDEMRLTDKLGEKHRQNEDEEAGTSTLASTIPSFCAARNIVCPSLSRGSGQPRGTAATGRVLSRTTRRHECQ